MHRERTVKPGRRAALAAALLAAAALAGQTAASATTEEGSGRHPARDAAAVGGTLPPRNARLQADPRVKFELKRQRVLLPKILRKNIAAAGKLRRFKDKIDRGRPAPKTGKPLPAEPALGACRPRNTRRHE